LGVIEIVEFTPFEQEASRSQKYVGINDRIPSTNDAIARHHQWFYTCKKFKVLSPSTLRVDI
jgi:hypothetical protein